MSGFADHLRATADSSHEAVMAELGALWMDYVGSDHHKDHDCHFTIEQYFSYGHAPYWTAQHYGYVDTGFGTCLASSSDRERGERRFQTCEEALAYCIDQTIDMFRRHAKSLSAATVSRLKEISEIRQEEVRLAKLVSEA